ncbi:hypothetical protein, partial [Paracoccus sp. SY]|uniref:hypothetical protein n=1 Tax=Paracoccus sp. SY TaxID=1330255 RepID=UPI001961EA04
LEFNNRGAGPCEHVIFLAESAVGFLGKCHVIFPAAQGSALFSILRHRKKGGSDPARTVDARNWMLP